METITIPVDSEIKTAFEQATPETLKNLTTLVNLFFKNSQKEKTLTEIITENSDTTEEDWGVAEQNAYARMNENNHQNIPGEVFLDWLSELEQGKNQDFVPTTQQITQGAEKSSSFDFLHAEPNLYTLADGEPI